MTETHTAEKYGTRRREFLYGVLGRVATFGGGNLVLKSFLASTGVGGVVEFAAGGAALYGAVRAHRREAAERDSLATHRPMRQQRIEHGGRLAGGMAVNYLGYTALAVGLSGLAAATPVGIGVGVAGVGAALYAFYEGNKLVNSSIVPAEQPEAMTAQEPTEPRPSWSEQGRAMWHSAGEHATHAIQAVRNWLRPEAAA